MPQTIQFMPMTAAQHIQYFGASPPVPVNQQNSGGLVASGGMPGYVQKMTAPARQQVIPAGETFTTTSNNLKSAAAPATVSTNQAGLQSIKMMQPLVKQISEQAKHYLAPGEKGRLFGEKVLGAVQKGVGNVFGLIPDLQHLGGMSPEDLTNYGLFQGNIKALAEHYQTARGWPSTQESYNNALAIVSPIPGEGPEYAQRLQNIMSYLKKDVGGVYKNTLSAGVPLTANSSPQNYVPPSQAVTSSAASNAISIPKPNVDIINSLPLNTQQRVNLAQGEIVTGSDGYQYKLGPNNIPYRSPTRMK